MFQNLRLWAKIMVVMGIAIGSVGAVLTFTNMANMNSLIRTSEEQTLKAHFHSIQNDILARGRAAETLSALVANIPQVQELFASGQRQALLDMFQPGFKILSSLTNGYGVSQFQFHTPPATSWLRINRPEKFGDDLSGYRNTVVQVNKTLKPVQGLEAGVDGIGVRGVVPLFYQGMRMGSVEFGMSFGYDFFDKFKEQNDIDAGLYVFGNSEFTTIASSKGKSLLLDTATLKKALDGEPQLAHVSQGDKKLAVYASAINDFSGKPLGVMELSLDNTNNINQLETFYWVAIVVGVVSILLGLFLTTMVARHIVLRLDAVSKGLKRVAEGDLVNHINIKGRDEIADLAAATADMQERLRVLVAQVSENAGKANLAAQEISAAVENQAATTTQMSSSVAEITSTMEELSTSSTQIADHSKSVVDIANQTLDGSRRGSEAMQTVLGRMNDIRNDNQDNLQEILELGEKSKHISKVMEMINALAGQTRLIAFNAALEASSAGEAGKRFSVVASEIRRLADSVTDSTGEIEAKVNEIQDSISRLVITSEKGVAGIEAGLEASTNTASRLNEIVDAASHTTSAAQQISLSTQQQKTASNQVVVALREIVSASSHTAESITKVSEISKELSQLSSHLDMLVHQFKLKDED